MAKHLNGALPKVIAVPLDCGETLLVEPVSMFAQQAIVEESERRFPLPDKAPFEKLIPGAVDPSMTTRAEDDPEWQKAAKVVENERNKWQNRAIVLMSVKRDDKLIKKYAQMRAQRLSVGIPEGDVWHDTLLLCLIASPRDVAQIKIAAQHLLPLEEEEVRDGLRIFRLAIQRKPAGDAPGEEAAPGIPPAVEEQSSQ